MNYADIKRNDAANGPGVRISLFVSGCTHHCKGCFNEEAWDFNYGKPYTEKETDYIISELAPSYIGGLTILGGEPMDPANQPGILPLLRKVRETYGNTKSIWIYTGYLFDRDILGRMVDELPYTREILSYVDVIMDGPFKSARIWMPISGVPITSVPFLYRKHLRTTAISITGSRASQNMSTLPPDRLILLQKENFR